MASEELPAPYAIPATWPRGNYLLVFDPLEGATNVDVNVTVGSIFSVYRNRREFVDIETADFLQPGAHQVCAGYALYGPTTMLVISLGRGVHGFTLDREIGEFIYTHPDLRVPQETHEFAINASNARFWEPAVKRYVDECLAGRGGPRGKDFSMRWVASLVAETHRILLRGGVFMYPRDSRTPASPGRMHLLFQANPIGFLIEQAGGRASSGDGPILDVSPRSLHQRIGLIFGSRHEVEVLEDYHRRHNSQAYEAPLFGTRGLFRGSP
jgi:fructose-1,6-bisphosphatase I/sedoheptulose-1,7-bisphosphatase